LGAEGDANRVVQGARGHLLHEPAVQDRHACRVLLGSYPADERLSGNTRNRGCGGIGRGGTGKRACGEEPDQNENPTLTHAADHKLLEAFADLETEAESGPYRPYGVVLRDVVEGLGRRFGFTPDDAERGILAASLPGWPPFADTRDALRALQTKYRLAVISNIDDDLFAGTVRSLGIEFDWVVTAAQVGSYKPSAENFRQALARFGAPVG